MRKYFLHISKLISYTAEKFNNIIYETFWHSLCKTSEAGK